MSNNIMQSTNTQHIVAESKSSTIEESTVSSTSPTKEGRVGQDLSTSQSTSRTVATSIIKSQTQDEIDTQAVAKNVKNSSVEPFPRSASDNQKCNLDQRMIMNILYPPKSIVETE